MAEYIKREAVINRIKKYASEVYGIDLDDAEQFSGDSLSENYCEGLYEATELIDDIPAADVVPVIHARWVDGKCSNCGVDIPTDDAHDAIFENECRFCYYCGAMMDGGNS